MRSLAVCVVLVVAGAMAYADTIYMADGGQITGKIISKDADTVVIQTSEGVEEISRKYVQRILVDAPAAQNVETAPAPAAQQHPLSGDTDDWDAEIAAAKRRPHKRSGEGETVIKLGIDFTGNHTVSLGGVSATESVATGYTVAAETLYYSGATNSVGLGMGAAYQIPRRLTEYDVKFNFIPIYAVFKVRSQPDAAQQYFYGVAHFGLGIFQGDSAYKSDGSLEGGLYYGFGAGAYHNALMFELLYSVNNGSARFREEYPYYTTFDYKVTYTKLSLSIGYKFM